MPKPPPKLTFFKLVDAPLEERPRLLKQKAEMLQKLKHIHWNKATLDKLFAAASVPEDIALILHVMTICPGCREVGGLLLDICVMADPDSSE